MPAEYTGGLGAEGVKALREFVEQGGTLVLFVGPAVSSDNYNQQLTPRGLPPGRLIKTISTNDNAFHFDFNDVVRLHGLGIARRAGINNVARSECHVLTDVADNHLHRENEIIRALGLPDFSV